MAPVLRRPAGANARSRSPRSGRGTPSDAVKGLKALLLGLERRPDRRKRCEDMLKEQVPWLDVAFFPATDGKAQTIPENEVSATWNTANNSKYGAYEDVFEADGKTLLHSKAEFEGPGVEYFFSPGERGCAHSHRRMWEHAAAAEGPTLILEDDVQLVFKRSKGGMASGKTFTAKLEQGMTEATKKGAEVLYLGWSGHRDGNYKYHKACRGKKNPVIRKSEYVWTTVAYVVWPAGAKKLLEKARPMDQPVDNFMAWECREGRLSAWVLLDDGDTDETWSGGIVTQADFLGDSDIKKSDGGDQDDSPTAFLASKTSEKAAAAAEAEGTEVAAAATEAAPEIAAAGGC